MENDNISSSSSSESKLPLIVGILGFALGAAGIVLGIQAKRLAVTATDEAAAAKMATSELSNTVATKATKEDILAVRADLDKGLADIAINEKTLADQITALQKVASAPKAAAGSGKTSTPPGPGEYVVAKGDNLSSIAKKAGISLKAIQDLNPGVDSNKLRIGQKLKTK